MVCSDCFRGGKAVGDPKGSISTIHGFETYVAGPPPTSGSGSTIIIYTDAFGLALPNNKLLADAYAEGTGFRVLVPDIIPGGPMSPDVIPIMDQVMEPVALTNVWGQLARIYNFTRAVSYFGPFMYRAFPASKACLDRCAEYAKQVKAELPPGAKLGVAGFCWGGYQSINTSSMSVDSGRLIDAQFCAHPSALKAPDDIVNAVTKFKTPVSIAHAENDFALPTKKVEETEALLRQKVGTGEGEEGFNYEIKIYKGVGHGFAVRAKPGDEKEADGADGALEQAIEWFKKWL